LIPRDFQLIFIREADTVQEALYLLHKFHLSSLPISDKNGSVRKSLDLLDLVAFLAKITSPITDSSPQEQLSVETVTNYLTQKVKTLGDISNRNLLTCVPVKKKLRRSIRYLARKDIHRIYLKEDDKLHGVLTQAMVVRFLYESRFKFEDILNKRVAELWPEKEGIIQMKKEERVLDAFRVLSKSKVSGVAVVNSSEELVGNISASDLKFINFSDSTAMFHQLNESLEDFLSSRMTENTLPIVATEEDSLGSIIQRCVENNVHRIYVIDNQRKPVFVISLSDILSQFII